MQCGVSLIKFTDKALLRKLVENEGVFLRFDVDVLSFFSGYSFLLLSITLGVSRGIRVMLFAISRCFFVVGLMMKPA